MPLSKQSFIIKIGDHILKEVVNAKLSRTKNTLAGELVFTLFINEHLRTNVVDKFNMNNPITVYINQRLAFHGEIYKKSCYNQDALNCRQSMDASSYNVRITARGKAYNLFKSSHLTYAGTNKSTTAKNAILTLLKPFNIVVDWLAEDIDLPYFTFRDGSKISDEIYRICAENSLFVHESREGHLVITDKPQDLEGDPLILGKNILAYEEYTSYKMSNSHLIVKGHRNNKHDWGGEKIKASAVTVRDKTIAQYSPYVVQHYGFVTEHTLKRRAKWELEQRKYYGNGVFLTVFGLHNDSYFDLGMKHFVSIPPLGINQVLECVEVEYVLNKSTITTQLILAPHANSIDKIPKDGGKTHNDGTIEQNTPERPLHHKIRLDGLEKKITNKYLDSTLLEIPTDNLNIATVQDYDTIVRDLYADIETKTNPNEDPEEWLTCNT